MMYQAPRGTEDILPQEQPYWRYVQSKAAELCQRYGYQRIDTPAFEDARLFVRSIGEGTDIVEKETYSFADRGGSMLTLRPEGTAPVCRAYLEHGMSSQPQPVKLYYIAPLFRYERPQKGRYRQHWQFGFEAIGEADPALDAEVMEMAEQLYNSLGLQGLTLLLNSIGCPRCRPAYLEELRRYYTPLLSQLCPDCKKRLERNTLRLLDCKTASCWTMGEKAPRSVDHLCSECADHFSRLQRYLSLLGLPFRLEHRLVRGLDYYTKTVFEFQPSEEGAQSTVGGGGRYDGLIEELGGSLTPAVGFATGLERVLLNLRRQEVAIPPEPLPEVFIAYMGEEAKETAFKLLSQLRGRGVKALMALGQRSLKAQLRQAGTLGVAKTLILGEDELRSGQVVLRHMARGEQETVPLSEINTANFLDRLREFS